MNTRKGTLMRRCLISLAVALVLLGCPEESLAPVAFFIAVPSSGTAPLEVQFTDLSMEGSAPITNHFWRFGDGSASSESNPVHTYTEPGTYRVTLLVSGVSGADTRVIDEAVTVTSAGAPTDLEGEGEGAPAVLEGEGEGASTVVEGEGENPPEIGPTADFLASNVRRGTVPFTVLFINDSLQGSSPIDSYLWDFGDGVTSTLPITNHTYSDPGVYDVRFTVSTAVGSDSLLVEGLITALHAIVNTWTVTLTFDPLPSAPYFSERHTYQFVFGEDNTVTWQVDGFEAVAAYTAEGTTVRIDDNFVTSPGTGSERFFVSATMLFNVTGLTDSTVEGSFTLTDQDGDQRTGTLFGWHF